LFHDNDIIRHYRFSCEVQIISDIVFTGRETNADGKYRKPKISETGEKGNKVKDLKYNPAKQR